MVAALVAFDVGVNLAFPFPADPLVVEVPSINRYFDYGRSVEGKYMRQVGPTDDTSAPIARAGWLADIGSTGNHSTAAPGHLLVSFYGMSFAGNVAEELQRLDPAIDVRQILGPAAPPNYVYEAYLRDRGSHESDIVVFGILASSVPAMDSKNGAGIGADSPAPFTFPIFSLEDGRLTKVEPLVQSLSELRETLGDPDRRSAFREQVFLYDKLVPPFMFEANILDGSAICRLARRSFYAAFRGKKLSLIHNKDGFLPGWRQVPVLERIVKEFSETAREDGMKPFVLLFQDSGYGDHLYRLLGPTLEENGIPYVSTHDIAPASDRSNFVSDGHFTVEANERITREVHNKIDEIRHSIVPMSR